MVQYPDDPLDILIERGNYITHCGYAGEEDPISTFRTPTLSVEAQFKNIFDKILKVDPAQHKVVIIKDAGTSQQVLRDEALLLFTKFHAKACAFVNAQVGILFSWVNKGSNGLIIDIGYKSTFIIPIIELITQMDNMKEFSMGGKAIEQFIIDHLIKHGMEKDIIENHREQLFPYLMREYFYFDSESEHDFEKEAIEKRKKKLPKYITIQDKDGNSIKLVLPSPVLPTDHIISFSKEINTHIIKILESFGKNNFGSIIKFNSDPYTSFWVGRIIITGGASNNLGLRSLLIRELLKIPEVKRYTGWKRAPSSPLVDVEFRDVAFTIRNVPPEATHSTWLGASIISSLNLFKKVFVSKDTYHNSSDILFQLDNKDIWTSLLR